MEMYDGDYPSSNEHQRVMQPSAPPMEKVCGEYLNLWQQLNHIQNNQVDAMQFRLHKINELQKQLESERDMRSCLAKKYQRSINAI